ncbi:hypothetical protein PYW08_011580 [Mythimna loreyi]|uniref:Uncharacterized protein n=1 Tax=Mythimna loreyi TaxID=667449 RepID=A0ACC2QME3_9NEOP|nr:hypothetical protein PYW08_011580 [Mythimna loreyi]
MCFQLLKIKKCCFFIPLRYGLIVWGYVTLCINFIFLLAKIDNLDEMLKKDKPKDHSILYESFQLVMMLTDLGLVILFVVAAHMKHVKLLKISFIGNLTSVILYTLWCVYMFVKVSLMLQFLSMISSDKEETNSLIWLIVKAAVRSTIEILLKLYIMYLLRIEIKKLEASGVFNFVNKAAEATCKMECNVEMEKGMFQQIEENNNEEGQEDIII